MIIYTQTSDNLFINPRSIGKHILDNLPIVEMLFFYMGAWGNFMTYLICSEQQCNYSGVVYIN